jgi:hypothetical protein
MEYLLRDFDLSFEIVPGKVIIANAGKDADSCINRLLGGKPEKSRQGQSHHCPKT